MKIFNSGEMEGLEELLNAAIDSGFPGLTKHEVKTEPFITNFINNELADLFNWESEEEKFKALWMAERSMHLSCKARSMDEDLTVELFKKNKGIDNQFELELTLYKMLAISKLGLVADRRIVTVSLDNLKQVETELEMDTAEALFDMYASFKKQDETYPALEMMCALFNAQPYSVEQFMINKSNERKAKK